MIINPYSFLAAGAGDPFFANVISLLHFDGANASTTFTDVISSNIWTPHSPSQISTAKTLVAGQVGQFSGATFCYISTPWATGFDFGTGDFTIEFTCMFSAVTSVDQIIATRQSDSPITIAIQIKLTGASKKMAMVFRNSSGGNVQTFTGTSVLTTNVKYAIGVKRVSGGVSLYVNNVLEATGTYSDALDVPAHNHGFIIGGADGNNPGSGFNFSGWIDEFRLTKGVGRDLTIAQTAPFPDHA